MIGIDSHNRLIYEGSTHYGHGVWPAPFVGPVFLIEADADWARLSAMEEFGPLSLVFREDSFDAVTRVRRGRIYQAGNSQPAEWYVQQHPAYKEDVGDRDHGGRFRKILQTFHIYRGLSLKARANPEFVIAIGAGESISLWSVLMVERNIIGEDLVTLRARSMLGVLPTLIMKNVPEDSLPRVRSVLTSVADAAYRAGATSVIDRCRDAAQVILASWFAHQSGLPEAAMPDLSALANRIEAAHSDRVILIGAAKVIARLHARGKPNEQLKWNTAAPTEADAETALALVGTLLREIGWAER